MRRKEKIHISREAIIQMVLSAIEVYPNECLGFLGKDKKTGVIDFVLPFQRVERSPTQVVFDTEVIKGLNIVVEHGGRKRIIGSFHSHCGEDASLSLSEADKISLPHIGEYAIIVLIPRIHTKMKRLKNGSVSFSQRWRTWIGAWRFTPKGIKRVTINIVGDGRNN